MLIGNWQEFSNLYVGEHNFTLDMTSFTQNAIFASTDQVWVFLLNLNLMTVAKKINTFHSKYMKSRSVRTVWVEEEICDL